MIFTQKIKKISASLLLASLSILQAPQSFAAIQTSKEKANINEAISLVNRIPNMETLLLTLKFSGLFSEIEISNFRAEVLKHVGQKGLSESLEKIQVDGSKIQIKSDDSQTIAIDVVDSKANIFSVNGKIFKYQPKLGLASNFNTLLQLLKDAPKEARISYLKFFLSQFIVANAMAGEPASEAQAKAVAEKIIASDITYNKWMVRANTAAAVISFISLIASKNSGVLGKATDGALAVANAHYALEGADKIAILKRPGAVSKLQCVGEDQIYYIDNNSKPAPIREYVKSFSKVKKMMVAAIKKDSKGKLTDEETKAIDAVNKWKCSEYIDLVKSAEKASEKVAPGNLVGSTDDQEKCKTNCKTGSGF